MQTEIGPTLQSAYFGLLTDPGMHPASKLKLFCDPDTTQTLQLLHSCFTFTKGLVVIVDQMTSTQNVVLSNKAFWIPCNLFSCLCFFSIIYHVNAISSTIIVYCLYVFGYKYDTELSIFIRIITTSSYLFYIRDQLLYIFYLVFL